MNYNNRFKMQDLFMNPRLVKIFPQFTNNTSLRNIKSNAESTKHIQYYLVGALNGTLTGKGELTVKGQRPTILRRVKQLQPLIEALFNNLPTIEHNLRTNTRLYTPFKSFNELESIKGFQKKLSVMQTALDNIAYNPNFQSENKASNSSLAYQKKQDVWKKKVNFKE